MTLRPVPLRIAVERYPCQGSHRLDTPWRATYSGIMFRKLIAALFVALWFVLLGIEFSEDMGLIEYDEPEMDRCVETTLTSLGEAIKISDDFNLEAPCSVFVNSIAYLPFSADQDVSFQLIREKAAFVKPDIPIYRLHQAFLI